MMFFPLHERNLVTIFFDEICTFQIIEYFNFQYFTLILKAIWSALIYNTKK